MKPPESLFTRIAPYSVQALRQVEEAEVQAAAQAEHHRYYAVACADCTTKAEVLARLAHALHLPEHFGGNLDALYDAMTDLPQASTRGWVIVLQDLPCTSAFTEEDREALVDVFRDATDFYAEQQLPFRVFYSFA